MVERRPDEDSLCRAFLFVETSSHKLYNFFLGKVGIMGSEMMGHVKE